LTAATTTTTVELRTSATSNPILTDGASLAVYQANPGQRRERERKKLS
jgi:hypothetical protein